MSDNDDMGGAAAGAGGGGGAGAGVPLRRSGRVTRTPEEAKEAERKRLAAEVALAAVNKAMQRKARAAARIAEKQQTAAAQAAAAVEQAAAAKEQEEARVAALYAMNDLRSALEEIGDEKANEQIEEIDNLLGQLAKLELGIKGGLRRRHRTKRTKKTKKSRRGRSRRSRR